MIRRFTTRLPSSTVRCSPSSSLSSSSSFSSCSYSFRSSPSSFVRTFSSSSNEKLSKQSVKPSDAHLAAAAAAAAFLPSAYISLSRDHLLRQADLPEYTRKWPQLWQLTSSELKQNNSSQPFNTDFPYPQPPSAAAATYDRFTQPPTASSSSSSSSPSASASASSSSSVDFTRYDWSDSTEVDDDERVNGDDDLDLDDDDLNLSHFTEVDDAGEDGDFTIRLDRVETRVSKLTEKLQQMQIKRKGKPAVVKTIKGKSKVKAAAGPKRRVGRPKKSSAATRSIEEIADTVSAASFLPPPPTPTAAELAAFMTASPARAQLYHQSAQALHDHFQQSLQHAISTVSLPMDKKKTLKNSVNDLEESGENTVKDEVKLDSTKRKRRKKMNRHQYKKRKKLERQRNSSATKKIHIS